VIHPDAACLDIEKTLTDYERDGYARLGRVADYGALEELRERANALMLGTIAYEGMFFQRDTTTGNYDELTYGKGWEGPSLNYRKIEKLERDPLYRAWIENPLFERVARMRIDGGISIYRAVLMTKADSGGTHLPWHQDAGKFWGLSKDPELQIWTALDDAPIDAGCVEVLPGSHKDGLVTPLGGVVPAHARASREADARAVPLPAKAGEVLLLHNMLWHRSGVNRTGRTRRAFSVCYMSDSTRCLRTKRAPREFTRVFA
jgi:phytanoyl-CoA hydroxylase